MKLVNLLQRKDPFESNCENNCKPCEYANKNGKLSHCHRERVNYEGKCENCGRVYFGETARKMHIRSNSNYNDLKHKRDRSWMWKHIQSEHANENTENITFSWKVSSKMRKPLERQLTESVRIARAAPEENLNSKSEFNSYSIKRLSFQGEVENFKVLRIGASNVLV